MLGWLEADHQVQQRVSVLFDLVAIPLVVHGVLTISGTTNAPALKFAWQLIAGGELDQMAR
ncbi:hypothetical protein D3C78_1749810 [compost metagenome]